MLFVFRAGEAEPELVIKVPDRAEERTAAEYEQRVLRLLTAGPSPVSGVPRPVEAPRFEALCGHAQTAMPGRPMTGLAGPHTVDRLAAVMTDWLIGLARSTITPAEHDWDHRLLGAAFGDATEFDRHDHRSRVSSAIGQLLADPSMGWAVRCHRDLGPWNVHVTASGRVSVVDWAESVPAGPLGSDLVHFLGHLALCAHDAYRPERRRIIMARLSDPADDLGRIMVDSVARYFRTLGLTPPPPAGLRMLAWLLAIGRQEPDQRAGSIYTHFLEHELRLSIQH